MVVILTGIITGMICVGINRVVETLVDWRNDKMLHMLQHVGPWPAFGINMAYGVTLVGSSALLVRRNYH